MLGMLEPPFLELQYYVGPSDVNRAFQTVFQETGMDIPARKLSIANAVGLTDKPEQIEVRREIPILRTEGHAFCGTERKNRTRLKRLGKQTYERFVNVAGRIDCVYGAILVEYSLEDPESIRKDPRSLAFRDFFLNRRHFESQTVDEIIGIAGKDSYKEKLETGVYISMSSEFNPLDLSVSVLEAQERSVRIARIIGQVLAL